MKKLLALFLSLIVTVAFARSLEKIGPLAAQKMQQDKKAIIIDVRELGEVQSGMVKDAIFLPLSLMQENVDEWKKTVQTFSTDKSIVIYCRSGKRAEVVGGELSGMGFKVYNMGGFDAWEKAGLPVETK